MNKYYRVNDVCRAILELPDAENGYSGSYDKAEILIALEDLPTIEVSEPQMEYKKWETPQKATIPTENNNCVSVAVALLENEQQAEKG